MHRNTVLFSLLFVVQLPALSQWKDTAANELHLRTAVTVTNTGISLIPTFSLGKPALIADLSLGRKKLFFEPQLRFALEGKPWSFIFWWRYKILHTRKINLSAGLHPSLVFRTAPVSENGVTKKAMLTRRYVAGELSPNYLVNRHVSIGFYYLYSRCLEMDALRNTHFITFNSTMTDILLHGKILARFTPQVFYLKQDQYHGTYFNSTLTLYHQKFPLSIQTIMNKTIKTTIPGSKSFVWNISLIASFAKTYAKLSQ